MEKQIKQIIEFHEKFKQTYSTEPTLLPLNETTLRYNLAQEELDEYEEACSNEDIVEVADSLADQLYILLGTVIKHGLQDKIIQAFDLVHQNNMSKLDENGEPILREDGKIIKPKNFKPVDLKTLFEK